VHLRSYGGSSRRALGSDRRPPSQNTSLNNRFTNVIYLDIGSKVQPVFVAAYHLQFELDNLEVGRIMRRIGALLSSPDC